MARGRTFAELIARKAKDRLHGPVEMGQYAAKNPLGVRVGGVVAIDTPACRDLFFAVREIAAGVEKVGKNDFVLTDYELVATPGEGHEAADNAGRVRRRLRVMLAEEGDSHRAWDAILLEQFYDCSYTQAAADGLYDVKFKPTHGAVYPALQDPEGQFHDFETGEVFTRRFGDLDPHVVHFDVLKDADGDGRVQEDEIEAGRKVQFWDYERAETVGGRARKVYLFAEQDADGWFRLYRGEQVIPEAITIL